MQLSLAGNAKAWHSLQREARNVGAAAGQEKSPSSIARSFGFECSCMVDTMPLLLPTGRSS
jgi:hypothetical protein